MGKGKKAEVQDPIIHIRELTKNYGNLKAVDNITLEIFKEEILGILGPNGAGKTTTINMICGLIPPSGGKIEFSGEGNKDKNEIKSSIGICPQENILWPKMTCLEQLLFSGEMYEVPRTELKKRSKRLLALLGLEGKSNVLSEKLSGGMKRRLNIALAVVHDPEILILDEPEAGLDPQSRVHVRELIKELSESKTIILTTHNMDEADRLSDRVAIIDRGKLLMLDTPENLKKTSGEGDALRIEIEPVEGRTTEKTTGILKKICTDVAGTENYFILRSKNIIELLPLITKRIEDEGFKLKEINLRENSLEDVFIHLTGRNLRQ